MTYVLVALIFAHGVLQEHISIQPDRSACETAAAATRATYPGSAVTCMAVPGKPA